MTTDKQAIIDELRAEKAGLEDIAVAQAKEITGLRALLNAPEPPTTPWANFPTYLLDHFEGQAITEDLLHRAAKAMLKDPVYETATADGLLVIAEQMYRALCEELAAYDPPISHVKAAIDAYLTWKVAAADRALQERPKSFGSREDQFNRMDAMASGQIPRSDSAPAWKSVWGSGSIVGGAKPDAAPPDVVREYVAAVDDVFRIERRETWTPAYKEKVSAHERFAILERYCKARVALDAALQERKL